MDLFIFRQNGQVLWQIMDLFFDKQGVKVGLLQLGKGNPLVQIRLITFGAQEWVSSAGKICTGNVHQIVKAQLVELFLGYVLGEETLIQPQGAQGGGAEIQFFQQFPPDGAFGILVELDPAAGEKEVGGAVIFGGKQGIVVEDDGAYTIIKDAGRSFKCQIHTAS